MDPMMQLLHNLRNDLQKVEMRVHTESLEFRAEMRAELKDMKRELSELNLWKARVLGTSAVLSALGSGVITLVLHYAAK